MIPTSVPTTSSHWAGTFDVNSEATGPATISNSTFTGNQAKGGVTGASAGGGALSNSSLLGATMTVTDCTLSGNAAIGAARGDGKYNFGSGQGGGINNFASLNPETGQGLSIAMRDVRIVQEIILAGDRRLPRSSLISMNGLSACAACGSRRGWRRC